MRLFREQVIFAQLNLTPLTADNAALVHALASWALHISPEPRVIEPLIEFDPAWARERRRSRCKSATWRLFRRNMRSGAAAPPYPPPEGRDE